MPIYEFVCEEFGCPRTQSAKGRCKKHYDKFLYWTSPTRRNRLCEYRRYDNRKRLLAQYGLTCEMYTKLHEDQKGLCAICKKLPSGKRDLVVDHNHFTGRVRALLCNHCNVVIAQAKEDIATLFSAIEYLKRFNH